MMAEPRNPVAPDTDKNDFVPFFFRGADTLVQKMSKFTACSRFLFVYIKYRLGFRHNHIHPFIENGYL